MKLHDAEVSKVAIRHRVRMTWVLTLTLMVIGQQVNGATFKRPQLDDIWNLQISTPHNKKITFPRSANSGAKTYVTSHRITGASGLEHDIEGPPSAPAAKTAADTLTKTTQDKERADQRFTGDDEDKDEDDDYVIRPPPPITLRLKRRAANETLGRRPRQPPRGVYFQTLGVPRPGRGLRASGLRVSLPGADPRRDLFDVYTRKRTMLLTQEDAGDLKAPQPTQDVVISSSNDNGKASTSISPAMHPAPSRLRRSAPSQASSKPATQRKRGNSSPSVRQAKPSKLKKKNAVDYETVHDDGDEDSDKDLEVVSNEDILDMAPREKRSDSKDNTDDYDASFEGDEYEVPEDDGSGNKHDDRVYKRLPRRVDDSDPKALDSSNVQKFTDPGNMKASDIDTSIGQEEDGGDEDAESVDGEDDKIRRQPRSDFMRQRQQQPSGGRFQRQRRKRHKYLTSKRTSTPNKAEDGGGGENVVALDKDVKDNTLNDALANVLDDMVNNPDDLSYLNTLRRRRSSEAVDDPMYSESYRRKRGPEPPRDSSRLNPIPKKRYGGGADETLTRPKRKFDLRDVINEMDVEEEEDSDSNDDYITDLLGTRRKRQAPKKRAETSDNNDDKAADFFRTGISKETAQQMEGDKDNTNLENSDLLRERTKRKAAKKNMDPGIPRSKRNVQDYVTINKDDQVKDEVTERELSNIALDYEEQTIPIVEDFDGDAVWVKRRRKRETYQVLPQAQDSSFGASSVHTPPNERFRKHISGSWDLMDRVRDAMRRKAKRKVRAISSWSDDPLPPDSNETGGLNVRASHSVSKQTKSADDGEREHSASNEPFSDEDYPSIPLIAADQPQDNNDTTTDDVLGSAFADTDDAVEADKKAGKDDDLKDVPKIPNLQNVTVSRRKRQATGDGAIAISKYSADTPKPNFIDDPIHESIDFAHLPMAEDEKVDLGISHDRFDKHLGASPAAQKNIIRELKRSSTSTEPSVAVPVKINTVKATETRTKENISLRSNQTDLRTEDTFSKRERGLLFLPADYSDETNVPLLHTRGKTFYVKDIVQEKTEKDRTTKMKRSATVETGDAMDFSPRRDVYDLTGRLKILPQDGNTFADKDFHTQSRVQGSLVTNVDPQNSQWMSEQMNRSADANQKPPSRRRHVLTSRQKHDAVGITQTPSQQKRSTGTGTTSGFGNSSKVKAKVLDRYKDPDRSMDEVLSKMMKEVMGVDLVAQNYIDLTMIPENNNEMKEAVTAMSRSPEKSSPVQNADNVAKSSDHTGLPAQKSIAAPSRTTVQVTASALPAIPARGSTLSPLDAVIRAEMADDTTGSEVTNAKGLADIRLANELAQAQVLLPSQAPTQKPIPVPRPVASSENRLTDMANDLAENAVSNTEDLSDIRLKNKAGHAKTFTPRSILMHEQIPSPEIIESSEERMIKPKAEDELVEKAIGNAEDLADISLTDELAEELFPVPRPTASTETVLTEENAANDMSENETRNAEDMTYSRLAKELGLPTENLTELLKSDTETNVADDEISIAQDLEAIQTELTKLMGYNVTRHAEEPADVDVDRAINFADLLDNPPATETSPAEAKPVEDEKSQEEATIKEEKEMLRELDALESEAADIVGLERPTASQELRRQRAWELVRDMLGRQAISRMLRQANHSEAPRTHSDAEHPDSTGTKPMPEDRRTQSGSNSEATPSQHNQQQRTQQQQQQLQEEEEQQQEQAEGTTADKKNEDNPVRRREEKLGTAGTAFQEALQKELDKIRKAQSFKDDRALAETKTTGVGTPKTDSDDGKADQNDSNASQTGRGRSSAYHNDHPDDGGPRVDGGGRQRRSAALDANSAVGSLGDEGEIDDDDGANEGADSNDLEARDGGEVDEQRLQDVPQGIHRLLGGAKHQRRFLRSVDTISESFEEVADEHTFDEIGDDENVVESIVVSKLGSDGKMKTQGDVNKRLVLEEDQDDDLNSGYSWWTDWSPCSATCGIGRRQRSRMCQVPGHCKGGNSQEDICVNTPCAE